MSRSTPRLLRAAKAAKCFASAIVHGPPIERLEARRLLSGSKRWHIAGDRGKATDDLIVIRLMP